MKYLLPIQGPKYEHYNIYDLPNILILQAYYLMLSLSENEVHLANEKKKQFRKSKFISLLGNL